MDYVDLIIAGLSDNNNPIISFIDKLGHRSTYELEFYKSSIGDFPPCWFTKAKRKRSVSFRWIATYQVTEYYIIDEEDKFTSYTPLEESNRIKTGFAGLFFDNENRTFVNCSKHLIDFKDLEFGIISLDKYLQIHYPKLLNVYGDEGPEINTSQENISRKNPNFCLTSLVTSDIYCDRDESVVRKRMESVRDFYDKKGKELFLVRIWGNLVIF